MSGGGPEIQGTCGINRHLTKSVPLIVAIHTLREPPPDVSQTIVFDTWFGSRHNCATGARSLSVLPGQFYRSSLGNQAVAYVHVVENATNLPKSAQVVPNKDVFRSYLGSARRNLAFCKSLVSKPSVNQS